MNDIQNFLMDFFSNGVHTNIDAINELMKMGHNHEEAENHIKQFIRENPSVDFDEHD